MYTSFLRHRITGIPAWFSVRDMRNIRIDSGITRLPMVEIASIRLNHICIPLPRILYHGSLEQSESRDRELSLIDLRLHVRTSLRDIRDRD
jgi:hypothetical protein